MAITLGLVEAIDSNGVYVSMPGSRGVLRGPYKALSTVAAGTTVLVASTDDGEQVVVGPVRGGDGFYNVKSFGAKGDGTADDTAAIQAAVDAAAAAGGGTVFVPAGRYMVFAHEPDTSSVDYLRDEGGIALASNVTLRLDPGATLAAITNDEGAYNIVRVYNKTNVTIEGGQIEGDRATHTGVTGEWGYGIAVLGGSDITIRDVTVSGCWGDGINLQRLDADKDLVPRDVVIHNVVCDDNRRQGMSIEGAVGVTVTSSVFSNTAGTAPGCGVDVEPWEADTPSEQIVFRDCRFVDNESSGLLLLGGGLKHVVVDGCHFEGNADSEAQVKSYSNGSGIHILNCRVVGGDYDAVRLQGGSEHLVAGNLVNRSISLIGGPSSSTINRCVVRDNTSTYSSGVGSPSYWFLLSDCRDLLVHGNVVNALDDQSTGSVTGAYVDGCERVRLSENRLLGVARGISCVSGSEDVEIVGNALDNNGVLPFNLDEVAGVDIVGNVIGGPCNGNSGSMVIQVTEDTTRLRVIDNVFHRVARFSGAGSDYAGYVLAWDTGVIQDVVTGGNRIIGALPLYPDPVYLGDALSTGYVGDDRGLMCSTTGQRPTSPVEGMAYYDTTLNKHITYNGSVWKDGTDTTV